MQIDLSRLREWRNITFREKGGGGALLNLRYILGKGTCMCRWVVCGRVFYSFVQDIAALKISG